MYTAHDIVWIWKGFAWRLKLEVAVFYKNVVVILKMFWVVYVYLARMWQSKCCVFHRNSIILYICQHRPWDPLNLLCDGYRLFPEGKERAELYFYSVWASVAFSRVNCPFTFYIVSCQFWVQHDLHFRIGSIINVWILIQTRQALYVHMTKHWGAFMQPLLQWKSKKYFWGCVCSLRHTACKLQATCSIVVCGLSGCIASHERHCF